MRDAVEKQMGNALADRLLAGRFKRRQDLPGRILANAQALWIEDVSQESDFPRAFLAQALGLKAAMAFPFLVGPAVVGVLEFFARSVLPADDLILDVMTHIGPQLGRVVERQWARQALERSEACFRSLTDNALDLITLLEEDGTIRYESLSVRTLLGYSREEYRGKSVFDFLHPEDVSAVSTAFQRVTKKEKDTPRMTFRLQHKDRSYRLMEGVGKNLLSDPVVQGFVLNARDVTDRKKLEEQFLQAQKVQAIGQLAGGIAHDFNNILTAIIGYTDLLLKKLPRAEGLHLNAEEIKKAAHRAASLTRQLLAFSRKQVLQPRVLDLNGVITDMDKMLRRLLGEHIDLVTLPRADLGRVKADAGQLEQVIMNLAVNARDAMSSQGKLAIETANVTLDAN